MVAPADAPYVVSAPQTYRPSHPVRTGAPCQAGVRAACCINRGACPLRSAPALDSDLAQASDHRREAVRRGRHRPHAGRLHPARRLFRERPLRAFVGGRPSARNRHAGGGGGQARQMDLRAPAGHSVEIRAEADREERGAAEDAAAAHQAQGRRPADQRLRRGPRRRADLPLHRAVREDRQADRAAVAAVDDARRPSATASSGCAATGRCGRSPMPRSAAPSPTGSSASTARAR